MILFKQVGKVAALRQLVSEGVPVRYPADMAANGDNVHGDKVDMNKVYLSQTSMAHTRWATHGVPSPLNCHPHVSDAVTEFSLVHNGIITNCQCFKEVCRRPKLMARRQGAQVGLGEARIPLQHRHRH